MSNQCQRKFRVVDQRVQGALLRRTCLHWCSFLILSVAVTAGLGVLTGDPSRPISNQMADIAAANFWPFLTLVAMLPMFLVDTVRLSARFAGPMVRLRRQMESLASDGDTAPIHFRQGDFWISAADNYNAIVDRYMLQQERIADLEEQIAQLTGSPVASGPSEAGDAETLAGDES